MYSSPGACIGKDSCTARPSILSPPLNTILSFVGEATVPNALAGLIFVLASIPERIDRAFDLDVGNCHGQTEVPINNAV